MGVNFGRVFNCDMYRIAKVGLHHFEEPCISGERGSGTIFFSGCNLRCVFCQNYEISHGNKGLDIGEDKLIDAMSYLVDEGAENINLVSPSIWLNKLVPTLERAKLKIKVPFVWNSSGFENVKGLKRLEGLVDVYLPDFKYGDNILAENYSRAKGYFDAARAAVAEMRRQQPYDVFDERGMMKNGVIVRHLVLPSAEENTRTVMRAIANIDKNMYVSLMGQYFPTFEVEKHNVLGRRIWEDEYDRAVECFFDAGLKNGFSQELESAVKEYVPSFDLEELEKILKL